MKIGIDAHSLEGLRTGARGRYLLNLVKEWSQMDTGDDHFILYFQREVPDFDFLSNKKFTKKVLRNPLKINSFSLYYNVHLPFTSQRDKPDVCFFPFYMLPHTYVMRNAVVTIHDLAFVAHPEWFSLRHRVPLAFLSRYAAKRAKYIITPSKFSKNEVKKHFKTPSERVKVTYLAPDSIFSAEKDEDRVNSTKRKFRLKNRYFLSVGTIFNRRFVDRVLHAFSGLVKEDPDWQFLISGRDLTNPSLHIDHVIREINKHAGREAVIRNDFIEDEDLIHLYKGADFCVYLSTYEGFGIPPLEAMASGSIALTTNYASLTESVNNAGYIMKDPEDARELREALQNLMTDEELRNELRTKGGEWVKQFSWKKTAEKTLKVLREATY